MAKLNVQIVNENDEIIGSKPRGEVDPQRISIASPASGSLTRKAKFFWLSANLPRFTTRESGGRPWPELWRGGDNESNIYKEAEEEIGLTGVKFKLGPKSRRYEPWNHFGQWFLVNIDRNIENFKIQEEEVEKIEWVPREKLMEDLKNNPERYIPSMPKIIEELI